MFYINIFRQLGFCISPWCMELWFALILPTSRERGCKVTHVSAAPTYYSIVTIINKRSVCKLQHRITDHSDVLQTKSNNILEY